MKMTARWMGQSGLMALLAVTLCTGCGVSEAIIDGFYSGISDTVASVISEALRAGRGKG